MTESVVEIRYNKREIQRKFALDRNTRDAMADYWRHLWPSNTAKMGARRFELTLDQARSVVAAKASQSTIDQIYKTGGWPVILAVGAMVVGYGADQFLHELRASHEQDRERVAALLGSWWPMAADRHPPSPDLAVPDRRRLRAGGH